MRSLLKNSTNKAAKDEYTILSLPRSVNVSVLGRCCFNEACAVCAHGLLGGDVDWHLLALWGGFQVKCGGHLWWFPDKPICARVSQFLSKDYLLHVCRIMMSG